MRRRADAASAVLDTNVVLDWLVFRDARAAALGDAITAGRLTWQSCAPMRDELGHLLASARLARWAPDADAVLALHDRLALVHKAPGPTPAGHPRCSDRDDQIFVDLGLVLGARWLITHDRALLRLARRTAGHGMAILTPMRWAADQAAHPQA